MFENFANAASRFAERGSSLGRWSVVLAAACGLFASVAWAQNENTRASRTLPAPAARTNAPVAAASAIRGYTRGAVQTLAVSGSVGAHMETLLAPGNGWIYGLEIGERADQPCYLGIWSVEGSAPAPGFPAAFSRCDGEVRETSIKTLGFDYARSNNAWNALREYGPSLALGLPIYSEVRAIGGLLALSSQHPPAPFIQGAPLALDGVGICQRRSNEELKGLRAHGSTLGTTGAQLTTAPIVTTEPEVVAGVTIPPGARRNVQVDRPNCNSWKALHTCPAHHVLVGLDVHYKFPGVGNQGRARITGLAPKCARVNILR